MVQISDILKARILIVDDQAANVSLLKQLLRGVGYVSVASTMDPNKVCELHRKNHYSLILLDLVMPGMDGYQVMEGLEAIKNGGYLSVLMITAQPDHKLHALNAKAKHVISKPFDLLADQIPNGGTYLLAKYDVVSKPFVLADVLMRVHKMLEISLRRQECAPQNWLKTCEH